MFLRSHQQSPGPQLSLAQGAIHSGSAAGLQAQKPWLVKKKSKIIPIKFPLSEKLEILMTGFQSELSSRRAPLMDPVLCEVVTVTLGKLSARAPPSSFPGSSHDGPGTSGPGRQDEETEKQPGARLAPRGSPLAGGGLSSTLRFVNCSPETQQI